MPGCDGWKNLMLDHLYDALEEADQRAFLDHLAGCPACQSALENARASKALLGRAARLHFPNVTFAPPMGEPLPGPRPVVLPMPVQLPPQRSWARWAIAAGILLALGGLGVPGYRAYDEYQAANRQVRAHHDAVADARKQVHDAQNNLTDAAKEHDRQLADVEREIRSRELRLVVTGPRLVQPGAPTDFLVHAYDLNGQKADADVEARLAAPALPVNVPASGTGTVRAMNIDAEGAKSKEDGKSKKESQAKDAYQPGLAVSQVAPGTYRVRIPPDARLRPDQALGMLVSARKKGGAGQAVRLEGEVKLTSSVHLTHLTTDKPMYQPGEVVRFRSLTLDRFTHKPAEGDLRLLYTLTSPLGAVTTVARGAPVRVDGKVVPGVGAGEVTLDAETAGGEWTLTVTEERGRFAPATRKFLVNRYQKPRLDKKLDFNRSSYGPGDEVLAKVSAKRADGGAVANSVAEATITVDGRTVDHEGKELPIPIGGVTDADGTVLYRFTLPKAIERGQASLAVKFEDQGVVETIVRPIPVVLKKLDVEFFPEGGDLVTGVVNRVYFQARTMIGKPAQMRGTLLENGAALPVKVETLHDDDKPGANQGQGVFAFTPKAGATYTMQIDSPAGIADQKVLPAAREDGVLLSVPKGVFEAREEIRVRVQSAKARKLMVGAYCRGQLLDAVELAPGATEAILRPTVGTGGVCRVTVFEELATGQPQRVLKPVAERLVYRHPKERLDVSITPDKRKYVPGQKATVSLAATGEKETLTPAWAMVAVVDKSVVVLADAKTDRAMPTHFLLTTEVRRADDLEHADFLLGDHPKAPVALDLLLGTQGWRRFAEQDPGQFRQKLHKGDEDDAERILVMAGQGAPVTTDFDQEKRDRLTREYEQKAGALNLRQDGATATLNDLQQDDGYKSAVATIGRFHARLDRARGWAVPVFASLLLVVAVGWVISLLAAHRATRRLGIAGLVCAALLVVSFVTYQPDAKLTEVNDATGAMALGRAIPPADAAAPQAQMGENFDVDKREDRGENKKLAALPPMPVPAAPAPAGGDLRAMGMGGFAGGAAAGRPGVQAPMGGMPVGPGGPAMRAATASPPPIGDADKGRMPAPGGKLDAAMQRGGLAMKPAERPGDAKPEGLEKDRKNLNRIEEARVGGGGRGRDMMDEAKGEREAFGARRKRMAEELAPPAPLVVREYAHARRPQATPGVRDDFAETVYWHPVLMLPDGKGQVSFDLCDSVTSFQVAVFAHTADGRLGAATKTFESQLPFSLAAKVPVEVTAGDRIDLPVAVTNNSDSTRDVSLKLSSSTGLNLLGDRRESNLQVAPEGRGRQVLSLKPTLFDGVASFNLESRAADFRDGLREQVRVVPDGFPVSGASSDLLEGSASHKLTLPAWLPGSLEVRVDVYPSTLADLQKGLEGLLREPHGCFEQSSTTNYPNVLILDYLKNAGTPDPALEKQTRDLLTRGYQKLTSFECQATGGKRQGYEWFGGAAPPHEALTAYGLLQFGDMAKVHDVDRAMLDRTRAYLLARRDGAGGFTRNPRALDTFGRAPDHVTNAYIVWALTEAGTDDLTREIDALVKQAKTLEDPYFLSLTALGLTNRGRREEATLLVRKVAAAQKETGQVEGAKTSITGSGGRDLVLETTALAVLAWLKTDATGFDAQVRKAVQWVGKQRGGEGAFGSTQATILALKALIAWAKANQRVAEAGVLRLYVGEEKVAELKFPAGVDKPLSLVVPESEKRLRVGENRLRVEITGANNIFPHTLGWSCRTATPRSAKDLKVKLETKLAKSALAEGDTTRLTLKMTNVSGQDQGMATAIVGLPAGLIVPEDLKQLKEHARLPEDGSRPLIGAFEVRGRELILYWRDLAKGQSVEVPVDLVARVPGAYRGAASRAYLYYNADHKHWVEPLAATIAAK